MLVILKNTIFHQFLGLSWSYRIIRLYASKLKIETLYTLCLYITCQISDRFEKVFGAQDRFRTVGHERFLPKITRFCTMPPLWFLNLQCFFNILVPHVIAHLCAEFQLSTITKTRVVMLFLRPPGQFWLKKGHFWARIRHYGFLIQKF